MILGENVQVNEKHWHDYLCLIKFTCTLYLLWVLRTTNPHLTKHTGSEKAEILIVKRWHLINAILTLKHKVRLVCLFCFLEQYSTLLFFSKCCGLNYLKHFLTLQWKIKHLLCPYNHYAIIYRCLTVVHQHHCQSLTLTGDIRFKLGWNCGAWHQWDDIIAQSGAHVLVLVQTEQTDPSYWSEFVLWEPSPVK